jgi:valyl-tRNA synthetase
MAPYFTSMASARATAWGPSVAPPALVASVTLPGKEIHVDVSGFLDTAAEVARLEKELVGLEKRLDGIDAKLGNENFVSRAPAEVVQQQKDLRAETMKARESAAASLAALRKSR